VARGEESLKLPQTHSLELGADEGVRVAAGGRRGAASTPAARRGWLTAHQPARVAIGLEGMVASDQPAATWPASSFSMVPSSRGSSTGFVS
jgi:hypothetical protein